MLIYFVDDLFLFSCLSDVHDSKIQYRKQKSTTLKYKGEEHVKRGNVLRLSKMLNFQSGCFYKLFKILFNKLRRLRFFNCKAGIRFL